MRIDGIDNDNLICDRQVLSIRSKTEKLQIATGKRNERDDLSLHEFRW